MNWKQQFLFRPHPAITVVVLALSLLFLWNGTRTAGGDSYTGTGAQLLEGTVVKVVSEEDAPVGAGSRMGRIQNLLVRLDGAASADREVMVYNDMTILGPGDGLYIGVSQFGTPDESFSIMDYKRASGLGWLVALFATLVIGVSGRKGVDALAGMAFTGAIIFGYTVPALLRHGDAFTVGLLSAGIILIGTFYLSYGFNRKSLAALAGVGVTLAFTGLLGRWVVSALHFTGYADESAIYLRQASDGVDIVGLVVAGIIIATVGVLDDVAVTQASTVMELAHAGSARGVALFRRAMRVGNDHISAVINTLLLAYTGAALPLLLLLRTTDFPFGFAVGGELVAEEAVRTLVSSMGLVLAVPLTTAVTVAIVSRWGAGEAPSDGHHHTHV